MVMVRSLAVTTGVDRGPERPPIVAMSLAHDAATVLPRADQRFWRMTAARADRLVRQPVVVLSLATVAALLVFVMATPRVLPILGGLVATLLIGIIGPWLSLAGLRGRLSFDAERCRVGDRVTYVATMTRFGRRLSQLPHVAWATTADVTSESASLVPRRRGRFPTKETGPTIESDWPFGIATARTALEVSRPLVVRPITHAVRFPVGVVMARRPGRDASTGLPGSAGDVLGLRDYRAGDSIRSIHWAQTARQGEVVVCERPGTAAPRVRIVLQGSRRDDAVPEPRLEAAVTVASSLVESWAARGADIDVCWTSATEGGVLLCPKDRRTLDATLDALACIEAVGETTCEPSRQVDLEVVILIVGNARATQTQEHPAATLADPSRANRRLFVTFEPLEGSDAIVVPASPSAAVHGVDKALAEIGHDPDATR